MTPTAATPARYAVAAVIDGRHRRIGISGAGDGPEDIRWAHVAARRTLTDPEYRHAARPWAIGRRYGLARYKINPYPWLVLDDDTALPNAAVCRALNELGRRLKRKLFINEGFRTRARQEQLWREGVARHGYPEVLNWVARPGTSPHETGRAADVSVLGSVDLANFPGARRIAAQLGLVFPLPWEPWHVELAR